MKNENNKRKSIDEDDKSKKLKRELELEKELSLKRDTFGCRSVDNYEKLNRIDEGTYGVVYRAKDKQNKDIVALKKLKLVDQGKKGFPLTSLREIKILQSIEHPNIINVKEVAVSPTKLDFFIVMDFVEHELKDLMEKNEKPFSPSEVKCLMLQLLDATEFMHDNCIIHRDLKTSNLLYTNNGVLKVADFGLARLYGEQSKEYSPLVVTLWYRAPELLLGTKTYTVAVDMWSVGCIFAEFISSKPLFPGDGEIQQVDKIFNLLGTPNSKIWPAFNDLPHIKNIKLKTQPYNNLKKVFPDITDKNFDLLNRFLTYDPSKRISASLALKHQYFEENPRAKDKALMSTWPSGKNEGVNSKRFNK
eukprot:TRINITY_DN9094_c0_g1_i1.p1 TRINITY_DN9094_c0_g1~~TRINITY_DN9094_c0_g1_i1.p1  ORF type:complete len:361 (-),score=100.45 TRINITY_DN9094_c0_g1_i1:19-1101(-)